MGNESGGREGAAREHRSWAGVVAKGIQTGHEIHVGYKCQVCTHASSLTPTGPKPAP